MGSTTKKKGGCLSGIIIMALVVAFFTNPERIEFDSYINSQISMTDNRVLYNNTIYIYDIQKYRLSTQTDNYFIFSIFYKEKRLYRSHNDMVLDRPEYVLRSEHLGLFANFWNLDQSYHPL
jgi:hypothetical protein